MEIYGLISSLLLIFPTSFVHGEVETKNKVAEWIGLRTTSGDPRNPQTVIVLLSNGTDSTTSSGKALLEEELFDLASDLEAKDPTAAYVHFDGDNLVSSQIQLFGDLEQTQSADPWVGVLDRVKSYRDEKKNVLGDLIVFQSYPLNLPDLTADFCGVSGHCRVISAQAAKDTAENPSRFKRQAVETTTAYPVNPLDEQYRRANIPYDAPAAFHLLFWTSLAIALTVYGVAYGMWHMDPGRDSIIYRMTSAQKYKKDK